MFYMKAIDKFLIYKKLSFWRKIHTNSSSYSILYHIAGARLNPATHHKEVKMRSQLKRDSCVIKLDTEAAP